MDSKTKTSKLIHRIKKLETSNKTHAFQKLETTKWIDIESKYIKHKDRNTWIRRIHQLYHLCEVATIAICG